MDNSAPFQTYKMTVHVVSEGNLIAAASVTWTYLDDPDQENPFSEQG